MRSRRLSPLILATSIVANLSLLVAVPALADSSSAMPVAAAGAVLLFALVIGAAAYVYFGLAVSAIARKTNTENAWWAWVPIIQILLMLNIAKKPLWWIILMFIPLVGIVIAVLVWMEIAVAVRKPNWWGILIIVPLVNLIVPGYLAWAD